MCIGLIGNIFRPRLNRWANGWRRPLFRRRLFLAIRCVGLIAVRNRIADVLRSATTLTGSGHRHDGIIIAERTENTWRSRVCRWHLCNEHIDRFSQCNIRATFARLQIVSGCFRYTYSLFDYNLIFLLTKKNNFLGVVFVINGGVYALTAPFWGWIVDKIMNPKLASCIGSVCIALAFCLIGPTSLLPIETYVNYYFNVYMNNTFFFSKLNTIIIGLVLQGVGMSAQLVASFADALRTCM